jgi:chemotaxis protein methyltransferase CheR
MTAGSDKWELEAIELDLLVDGIRRHYDLDLGAYSRPLLLRRLRQFIAQEGLPTLSALQALVLHDSQRLDSLLASITSDPSPLFDDASFLRALREEAIPWLKTHPSLRIWHAGCASPEDVFTLAIVLHEEGLLARTRLYVTDASEELLARAQSGSCPAPGEQAQARYVEAGGRARLADYFQGRGKKARLKPALQERIFYSQHHLAHEGPFNEFHAVLCRNTLIYFNRKQHGRIHGLIFESLARFGYLGIGRKESLRRTPHAGAYDEVEGAGRLYRRIS